MSRNPQDNVVGTSPLGGSGIEATGACNAPIRDTSVQKVPLLWDDRVGAYISEQAIEELDDREESERRAETTNREEEYRSQSGYRRS